jgi:phosphatidylserine/phosphatidylglycerophosphate/cardiolipin synthase-like enzyme
MVSERTRRGIFVAAARVMLGSRATLLIPILLSSMAVAPALRAQECAPDPGTLDALASVSDAATFAATAPAATGACVATGKPVRTVVPGESYLPAVNALLDSATTSIDILEFNFFTDSGPIKALADKLIAMKKANPALKIRVAMESEKDGTDPHGVKGRNAATEAYFKDTDIDVFEVRGVDGTNGVSHTKALVVDGTKVLAGSTNWSNTSTTKNNEMNMRVDSAAFGCAFTKYFDDVISAPGVSHPSTTKDGPVTMLTDTTYDAAALKLINSAKADGTIDFSMYWFSYKTDADTQAKAIFDALVAAAKRGVTVRGFLEHNGDPAIAPGVTKVNERVAPLLAAAGVQMYFDPPGKISHAKMLIVDKKTVLTGSTNWAAGDLNDCHQVNWLIKDKKVAAEMSAWLDDRIKNEGTKVEVPTT